MILITKPGGTAKMPNIVNNNNRFTVVLSPENAKYLRTLKRIKKTLYTTIINKAINMLRRRDGNIS
jgi:hypothetical protein